MLQGGWMQGEMRLGQRGAPRRTRDARRSYAGGGGEGVEVEVHNRSERGGEGEGAHSRVVTVAPSVCSPCY